MHSEIRRALVDSLASSLPPAERPEMIACLSSVRQEDFREAATHFFSTEEIRDAVTTLTVKSVVAIEEISGAKISILIESGSVKSAYRNIFDEYGC